MLVLQVALGGIAAAQAQEPTAPTERPLTYREVLQAAIAGNGDLAVTEIARDRAEAQVLGANGLFDPLLQASVGLDRSRSQGFLNGFPYDSRRRAWQSDVTLSGVLGTGTDWSVSSGLSRNQSTFVTRDLGGDATRETDAFVAYTGVSLTQQLLEGVRFRYNVQNVTLARQALDAAGLSVEKQRQDTLYAAAEAYWTWSYQIQLHTIALDAVAVAEEALRVGNLQVERGQLAPVEATRLEAALVQARSDALDARNAAEQAANVVLLALGEDPGEPIAPATEAGDVPDTTDIEADKAVAVALEQNLDLALARQQVETAGTVLDNAKHALLPSLAATLDAGVASQRCPNDATDCSGGNALDAISGLLSDENQPYVSVGGLLSVPLGNRAARGARDVAAADVALRDRQLQDTERLVAAAVEEQVRTLQSARQRMELADANVRLAEETLRAEEALAAAGRTIQKNVLEARTEVARTRAEAAKARTDTRLAQARLLALQGQLSAEQ
ncbi:MAG: TolC family protein [Myxococcota bacterium]